MWKIILVCAVLVGSANSAQRKRYIYSGRGNYAPDYNGFLDPYEFHQRLTQQILSQQSAQNNAALTSVYASDDASAFAEASNYDDYDEAFQEQFAQQQAFFDNLRRQHQAAAASGFSAASGGSGAYAPNFSSASGAYTPNYASATGSFAPTGYHQSAAIFPENPSIPNIQNRFSESVPSGNGFHGVSVNSYASSSDINGKKTSHRGASTTINDNGKVTSYNVHS